MEKKPTHKELLKSIREEANELFSGSKRDIRYWMGSPMRHFNGRSPAEMKKTRDGAERVHTLLLQIKYGVYI